jgi:hypothetical protein
MLRLLGDVGGCGGGGDDDGDSDGYVRDDHDEGERTEWRKRRGGRIKAGLRVETRPNVPAHVLMAVTAGSGVIRGTGVSGAKALHGTALPPVQLVGFWGGGLGFV